MATPRVIYLSPESRGLFSVDAGKSDVEASAKKTSELLQRNHEKAHIFVNEHMMHVSFRQEVNKTLNADSDRITLCITS
jgi:hypothetical protein